MSPYSVARSTYHFLDDKGLVPRALYRKVHPWLWARAQPDRNYLVKTILPATAKLKPGRVLFVGTQPYTKSYGKFFAKSGCEFWTMDFDPAAAKFGAPGKHIVASVTDVDRHFEHGFFDIVFLNGVFGFGVNDTASQKQTLAAIHQILKPGGILLLGWNTDRVADPMADAVGAMAGAGPVGFAHTAIAGMPARQTFANSTHVFDLFRPT
jgi:SAM-dependent methyltransferase